MKKPRARERKPRTWWLVVGTDGSAEAYPEDEVRDCSPHRVVRVVEQAKGRGVKRT